MKNLFKRYPFTFNAQEDVSILDGKYEGIYSWLTLNYAISGSIQSKTCSLDLGGGSTQVTFVPTDQVIFFHLYLYGLFGMVAYCLFKQDNFVYDKQGRSC